MKRDDVGYGSIQDKYNAKDQQINMIRKHPALKDAETNITVFNIIDDTKDGSTVPTPASVSLIQPRNEESVGSVLDTKSIHTKEETRVSAERNSPITEIVSGGNNKTGSEFSDADSASAFANL